MCVCVHTSSHIYIYIILYCLFVRECVRVCAYIRLCACSCVRPCLCVCAFVLVCMRVFVLACVRVCVYASVRA